MSSRTDSGTKIALGLVRLHFQADDLSEICLLDFHRFELIKQIQITVIIISKFYLEKWVFIQMESL